MVYIVPKKDQFSETGFLFPVHVSPDGKRTDITLPKILDDETFESCSSQMMELIAKRLGIEGLQGKRLYAEIRNRIQFEN